MIKRLKDKVEKAATSWLDSGRKDIQQPRSQPSTSDMLDQLSPEIKQALKDKIEKLVVMQEIVKIIEAEDRTQPPAAEHVDRYYEWHCAYVDQATKAYEEEGAFFSMTKMEKAEYLEVASQRGWLFLTDSCGLPHYKPNESPKSPWRS